LDPSALSYYMPVRAVFKQSSTPTKLRPVFDASAPTSSEASLNDTLNQGPNLYPNLADILFHGGHQQDVPRDQAPSG